MFCFHVFYVSPNTRRSFCDDLEAVFCAPGLARSAAQKEAEDSSPFVKVTQKGA